MKQRIQSAWNCARRGVLPLLLTGLSVALLPAQTGTGTGTGTGNGNGTGTGTSTQGTAGEIEALNAALTMENLLASFYNQYIGVANGGQSVTGITGTVSGTNVPSFTLNDAQNSNLFSASN